MQHYSTAFLIIALVIVVNEGFEVSALKDEESMDLVAQETRYRPTAVNVSAATDGPVTSSAPASAAPPTSPLPHPEFKKQYHEPPRYYKHVQKIARYYPVKMHHNSVYKYKGSLPHRHYYSQPLPPQPLPPQPLPPQSQQQPQYSFAASTTSTKATVPATPPAEKPKFSLPVQTIHGVRADSVRPPYYYNITTTTTTTTGTTTRPLRTKRIWPKHILDKMNPGKGTANETKKADFESEKTAPLAKISDTATIANIAVNEVDPSESKRVRYVYTGQKSGPRPPSERRYVPVTRAPKRKPGPPARGQLSYNYTKVESNDWVPILPSHYRAKRAANTDRSDSLPDLQQPGKHLLYLHSYGIVPMNEDDYEHNRKRNIMMYPRQKRLLKPHVYSGYSPNTPDSSQELGAELSAASSVRGYHPHTKIKHHHHHHHHRYIKTVEKPVQVPVRVEVPRPYPVAVPVERRVPYEKIVEKPVPYPVTVEKRIPYPVAIRVPHPVPVKVVQKEFVPRPYPVVHHVPVMKPVEIRVPQPVPVPVERRVPYPVEVKVPVPVDRPVPFPVEKRIPYPVPVKVLVPQPYPVEKKVPFPIEVRVKEPIEVVRHVPIEIPYPKPYPVKIPHPVPFPVEKKVPYPITVEKEVPVPYEVVVPQKIEVEKKIPVYVPRPYEVEKKVPVPVKVPYPVKVPVKVPVEVPVKVPVYVQSNQNLYADEIEESTVTGSSLGHGATHYNYIQHYNGFHSRSDVSETDSMDKTEAQNTESMTDIRTTTQASHETDTTTDARPPSETSHEAETTIDAQTTTQASHEVETTKEDRTETTMDSSDPPAPLTNVLSLNTQGSQRHTAAEVETESPELSSTENQPTDKTESTETHTTTTSIVSTTQT